MPYRSKYRKWAIKNQIVPNNKASNNAKEILVLIFDKSQYAILAFAIMLILWRFVSFSSTGPSKLDGLDMMIIESVIVFLIYSYIAMLIKFHLEIDFIGNICIKIKKLFPHATQTELISNIGLPSKFLKVE